VDKLVRDPRLTDEDNPDFSIITRSIMVSTSSQLELGHLRPNHLYEHLSKAIAETYLGGFCFAQGSHR